MALQTILGIGIYSSHNSSPVDDKELIDFTNSIKKAKEEEITSKNAPSELIRGDLRIVENSSALFYWIT